MANINDIIALVTIAPPITHRALSVYPLLRKGGSALTAYLVLDEALASEAFRITEVSEGGHVPRLLAYNETDSPVLLLDGEELVGAKQNRVLNLSLMVDAKSETEIPVSCVEAGRWSGTSRGSMRASGMQYCLGRAEKMEQVSRSLRRHSAPASDQSAVWDHIAAKSARMGVASETSAMRSISESRRDDLDDYLKAIPTAQDQVGAVYAIGNKIIGLELFDTDATYRRLAGKLVGSYALDAMEESESAAAPDAGTIKAFVDGVRSAASERFATVGLGESVRLSSQSLVGAALEVSASCVHLSAFHREEGSEDEADIRARTHRSRLRRGH
jgi:hypothetical protein